MPPPWVGASGHGCRWTSCPASQQDPADTGASRDYRGKEDSLRWLRVTSSAAIMMQEISYVLRTYFYSYERDDEDDVTGTPLAADQLVRDCPQKQAAVAWPLPVDARLDELLAQADAAGENTSRKELVAAIIASTRVSDTGLAGFCAGTVRPRCGTWSLLRKERMSFPSSSTSRARAGPESLDRSITAASHDTASPRIIEGRNRRQAIVRRSLPELLAQPPDRLHRLGVEPADRVFADGGTPPTHCRTALGRSRGGPPAVA